ncbi:Piwi domain-containing protein [Piptocephalis cylindrospora]|uniref:Piwi domain-containing protein n=1 Tax=Piptocephalis cylindrospora TaxID=1907219 RepID=A0A4P9Y1J0_9FUNG|nr:Piwi domain-containing protein [Piptocephalis cylindrospora]|eukprot:RKP11680.1 Piwi domain-containing protein [Piptocephalis cylindrospora]
MCISSRKFRQRSSIVCFKPASSNTGRPSPGGPRVIHDGRANAFSIKPLLSIPHGPETFLVSLASTAGISARHENFKVTLALVNRIDITELQRFLQRKGSLTDAVIVQALDILVRYDAQRKYIFDGKSTFISPKEHPISGGLVVRQGLYQSVRPAQDQMLLLCDIASRAFYPPGPLTTLLPKILGIRNPQAWRGEIHDRDFPLLDRYVRTMRIDVTHRGADFKPRYSLQGITRTPASSTFFTQENGAKMNVAQYFHQRYNIRLRFPFLPCVRTSKKALLPMEVCVVEPGQVYRRKLGPDQTSDMIRVTAVKPFVRQKVIQEGVNLLRHNTNPDLLDFGVRIGNQPVSVRARVLPAPTIAYHHDSRESRFAPANGAWNLRAKRLYKGASLRRWMVMVFASYRDIKPRQIEEFVRELLIVLSDSGIRVETSARNPKILPPIIPQSNQNLTNAIRTTYLVGNPEARSNREDPNQIVLCILRDRSIPIYTEIKRIFETDLGIPTQCCLFRHVIRPNKQYCANVGLKINLKLGGVNHILSPDPQSSTASFYAQAPTLVVGADVIHPDPGSGRQPSIAGIASSNHAAPVRFYATAATQKSRMEIIEGLETMMVGALKAFFQATRNKPARILFFRDGVGEGMFQELLRTEIPAIKKGCHSVQPGYNPKLSFIVVQKRHHVRFFPLGRGGPADRSGNCLPGTTVDRSITHPSEYDFYVQSHAGLQGTSRPTHYHVLHDEIKIGSDSLQALINDMCYLYGRATRAVRIVPAVYYADQVVARARAHFGTEGEGWSEAGSETGSVSSTAIPGIPPLTPIKERLKTAMYFT